MKFTKELLDAFEECVCNDDGHYIHNFEEKTEDDFYRKIMGLEKPVKWKDLRERIEFLEKFHTSQSHEMVIED